MIRSLRPLTLLLLVALSLAAQDPEHDARVALTDRFYDLHAAEKKLYAGEDFEGIMAGYDAIAFDEAATIDIRVRSLERLVALYHMHDETAAAQDVAVRFLHRAKDNPDLLEEAAVLLAKFAGSRPEGLPEPRNGRYRGYARISRRDKMRIIIIPRLHLRDVPLTDAVDLIRQRSVELDPDGAGVNIHLTAAVDRQNPPRVNMHLEDVPLGVAVAMLAQDHGLRIDLGANVVHLYSPKEIGPLESRAYVLAPGVLSQWEHRIDLATRMSLTSSDDGPTGLVRNLYTVHGGQLPLGIHATMHHPGDILHVTAPREAMAILAPVLEAMQRRASRYTLRLRIVQVPAATYAREEGQPYEGPPIDSMDVAADGDMAATFRRLAETYAAVPGHAFLLDQEIGGHLLEPVDIYMLAKPDGHVRAVAELTGVLAQPPHYDDVSGRLNLRLGILAENGMPDWNGTTNILQSRDDQQIYLEPDRSIRIIRMPEAEGSETSTVAIIALAIETSEADSAE